MYADEELCRDLFDGEMKFQRRRAPTWKWDAMVENAVTGLKK